MWWIGFKGGISKKCYNCTHTHIFALVLPIYAQLLFATDSYGLQLVSACCPVGLLFAKSLRLCVVVYVRTDIVEYHPRTYGHFKPIHIFAFKPIVGGV